MPVREEEEHLILAPDPRLSSLELKIPRNEIISREETTLMPPSLVNTCTMDEILDLLAYLSTGGNAADPAFRSPP